MSVMKVDRISPDDKVEKLSKELYDFIKEKSFKEAKSMGQLVQAGLNFLLKYYLK